MKIGKIVRIHILPKPIPVTIPIPIPAWPKREREKVPVTRPGQKPEQK